MRDPQRLRCAQQHSSLDCVAGEVLAKRLIESDLLLDRAALIGGERCRDSCDQGPGDGRSAAFDWAGNGLGSRHPLANAPSVHNCLMRHLEPDEMRQPRTRSCAVTMAPVVASG